jgi:hypothetical protein
MPFQLAP